MLGIPVVYTWKWDEIGEHWYEHEPDHLSNKLDICYIPRNNSYHVEAYFRKNIRNLWIKWYPGSYYEDDKTFFENYNAPNPWSK